eukprot:snap_masked-scaffold447_size167621-processed-gene-0.5 protein:Tk02112 transcript:snap_masked-scaffold447_size167621-processed-gene-0.5-mRNA-1 annotation:"Cirhin"
MAPVPVHTLRFYRLEPSAIHAMAWSAARQHLAVSRADNAIEIWDFAHPTPCLAQWFPGNAEASIEALAWGGPRQDRLFSTGLHGLVLEYDLARLATRTQSSVTSGPSWCMGVFEDRLAVGTEEGYVCLFRITEDGLVYDQVLDKQEGRILCLAWHSSGRYIVTGSPDTIRVWNVETGHPMQRMTTGRVDRHRETTVWSVDVADDLTIVSGDSRGKTSFWNGQQGTLLDSYQTHQADVLVVAFNPEQSVAFASGVDPLIVHFQPITKKDGRRKWIKSIHRFAHTHDVRAMVCLDQRVISGGVDTQLVVNDLALKSVTKYPPIPKHECVHMAEQARAILLQYHRHLELWRLCDTQRLFPERHIAPPKADSSYLPPEAPEKLLHLETKDDEVIRHAHVSDDGGLVAHATTTRLCVFSLELEPVPKLTKLKLEDPESKLELPHLFRFYVDAKSRESYLVSATELGNIQIFRMDDLAFTLERTFEGRSLGLSTTIAHLKVNPAGSHAFMADHDGNLVTMALKSGKQICQMARYQEGRIVDLNLRPDRYGRGAGLMVAYSDNRVAEFHPETGKHSAFSSSLNLPKAWNKKRTCTRGIAFAHSKVVFYDDLTLCSINIGPATPVEEPKLPPKKGKQDPKVKKAPEGRKGSQLEAKLMSKYEHLIHLSAMGDDLVAVEVKAHTIEEQLPPNLRQKKFGAM